MARVTVVGEDDDEERSGDTKGNGQTRYHRNCKCNNGAGKCGRGFTTFNSNDKICSACLFGVHNH